MFDHFSVPAGYQITDALLCLFVISLALESVIHLKESGIPLKNRIPSSIEKESGSRTWNPESTAWSLESKTVMGRYIVPHCLDDRDGQNTLSRV